jgi:hypothetical protein
MFFFTASKESEKNKELGGITVSFEEHIYNVEYKMTLKYGEKE